MCQTHFRCQRNVRRRSKVRSLVWSVETHKLEEDVAERVLRLRLGLQTGLQRRHKLPMHTQDLLNVGEQDLRAVEKEAGVSTTSPTFNTKLYCSYFVVVCFCFCLSWVFGVFASGLSVSHFVPWLVPVSDTAGFLPSVWSFGERPWGRKRKENTWL